jgi:hypothetical protein
MSKSTAADVVVVTFAVVGGVTVVDGVVVGAGVAGAAATVGSGLAIVVVVRVVAVDRLFVEEGGFGFAVGFDLAAAKFGRASAPESGVAPRFVRAVAARDALPSVTSVTTPNARTRNLPTEFNVESIRVRGAFIVSTLPALDVEGKDPSMCTYYWTTTRKQFNS